MIVYNTPINPAAAIYFKGRPKRIVNERPYHVFQMPREDLDVLLKGGGPYSSRKGKRKATEEDIAREEIAGAWLRSFATDRLS